MEPLPGENRVSSKFAVTRAESDEDKQVAFGLRHQVLVEELGYDPETGAMEPGDKTGAIFLAHDGDAPIGTVSVDWWKDVEIAPERIAALELDAFSEAFGRESVFVFRKAAVLPRYRRTTAAWELLLACADFMFRKPAPHFLVCDCAPKLIRYYQGAGLRCYAPHFSYEIGGLSVPMCAAIGDLDYLRQSEARLYPVAMKYGLQHMAEVQAFFAAKWVRKPRRIDPDGQDPHVFDPNDEAIDAVPLERIPLFKDMEASSVRHFLQSCEAFSVGPDKTFISADDASTDLHLIRRGYVEVTTQKLGRRVVVANLAPGDLIGEMNMLLQTGRTADVTTLTEVDAYRIPAKVFRGHFAHDPAALARINLNLAELLARRLRATTRLVG